MLSAVHAVVVYLSVRLSLCVSVTLRYCVKTAKRRITQIMPHDSDIFSCRISTDKHVARSLCDSRATCCLLLVSAGPRRITLPNFIKIGCSIAEILHFFLIFMMAAPPSWIFEIAKFYWFVVQSVETHQHAKFRQNRSIGCEDIKIFSIFQDGGSRHLVFSKS